MIVEFIKLVWMLFSSRPSKYDKVIVYHMKHFPFRGFGAMMWCGRFIVRTENAEKTERLLKTFPEWRNHEEIHLQQAKRYKTWVGYYLRYLFEWLKGNPLFNRKNGAYYTIPFEVEAYANENNLDYIINDNLKESAYNIKRRVKTFKIYYATGWKSYIKTL